MSKRTPELPTGPLRDLLAWWRTQKVKGMLIGGLAVAFLGKPRTTNDVDAIIALQRDAWEDFLHSGGPLGFATRIPDALAFAETNRVMLLHHAKSGVDVDISLAGLPFEMDAIQRAQKVRHGRLILPIPTIEDLIVLKAVANRPKDKVDIEGILDLASELNYALVRKYVEEFSDILESPEIYKDLDERLRDHRNKNPRK